MATRLLIKLHQETFSPLALLSDWKRRLAEQGQKVDAAESLFIGHVRGTSADGTALNSLELEHYPGMTEQQLDHIAKESCQRHGVDSCLIHHRIGQVFPGEAIVLVAVGANRRGPAQRCCQELLEELKHNAPFWKREWRADGTSAWIKGNTPH